MRRQGRHVDEEVGVGEGELARANFSKVVGRTSDVVPIALGLLVEGGVTEKVAHGPCSSGAGMPAPHDSWGVVEEDR